MTLVETHELTKRYPQVTALAACSLSVARGEVFGLLGPNGAGKTTLIRLLLGFLTPSSGWAKIDGHDCHHQSLEVRKRVSYLPGDARLFRRMRGRDVLRFFADIRPRGSYERSLAMAERLELDLSRQVGSMSTGMRQKTALVAALAADTPLVILDEPTSNLDPTVRAEVGRMVLEAKEAGRTVLFSSHVLSEVEDVCDRVVILRGGHIVHTQTIAELKRRHRIRAHLSGPLPEVPSSWNGQVTVRVEQGDEVIIETPGELSPLLGWLSTLPLRQMVVEPVGLRAVYDQFHG